MLHRVSYRSAGLRRISHGLTGFCWACSVLQGVIQFDEVFFGLISIELVTLLQFLKQPCVPEGVEPGTRQADLKGNPEPLEP